MMRETLSGNSRHAYMLVSPGKGLAFQRRASAGGASAHTSGGQGSAPAFVKLERAGDRFSAFSSKDGSTWKLVGRSTITMAETIYVGLAVTSHVKGELATATFDDVAVKAAPPPPPDEPKSPPPAAPKPPPQPVASKPSKTLRLLHWNSYHGGRRTDGQYDPAGFVSWLVKFKPDVISLNEVDSQGQVDTIVKGLKEKTGTTWHVSYSGRGNLLLSRLPMNSRSRCAYPDGKRYAAHLSTVVNGRSINVWTTHLSLTSSKVRVSEVKSLQACSEDWPQARILAGDYNMQADTAEYKSMTEDHADVWRAAKALGTAKNYSGNCDGCTRNSRIDYVFTAKGVSWLKLKSVEIIDTRNSKGVRASDHKPMMVVYDVQ